METIQNNYHLSGESLEEYVRGRLPASKVAQINEHLFECDSCYQLYEQENQFLIDLRNAAPAPQGSGKLFIFWSGVTATPHPFLWAAAAAVILIAFFVPHWSNNTSSPAFAELTAFRSAGAVSAPANRHLTLRLDTTGIAEPRELRAGVADRAGNSVWNGNANLRNGNWEVSVDKKFAPGQYWVRIYSNSNEMLREYSLLLK